MLFYFYVESDNWNGVFMTAAALKAARLAMSTADWHTHKALMVSEKKLPKDLIDYEWPLDQWINYHTKEVLWAGRKEESTWDVM